MRFFKLYRCTECGWLCNAIPEGAIGTAHAHAERHTRGFFGLLPAWMWPSANPDKLDQCIEEIVVEEVVEIDEELEEGENE